MKQITISLLLVVFLTGTAQNQMLSSREEFLDTSTNTFVNNNGYDYSYDSAGNLAQQIFYFWDDGNNTWIPFERETYTYNAQGRATLITQEEYDTATSSYSFIEREVLSYDVSNRLIQILDQQFQAGNFVNSERFTIFYNVTQIATDLFEIWDGTSWVAEERSTYSYNANQQISSVLFEEVINNTFVSYGRENLSYDSAGRVISDAYQDQVGGTFVTDELTSYTFDAAGNNIDEISSFLNIPTPDERRTYSYDTSTSINVIDHPFNDKTGLDYVFNSFPFVNKPLSRTSQQYNPGNMNYNAVDNRTFYNYTTSLLNEASIENLAQVVVHPNPTTDIVNVFTQYEDDQLTLKLFDLLGKELVVVNAKRMDLTSVPSGIYLLQITNEDGNSLTRKIVKE
ncbi:MAG: T9SS type A sorting domain-containing protein [Nonlabens sp.]